MITLHFHLIPQYKYELFHIYFTKIELIPLELINSKYRRYPKGKRGIFNLQGQDT